MTKREEEKLRQLHHKGKRIGAFLFALVFVVTSVFTGMVPAMAIDVEPAEIPVAEIEERFHIGVQPHHGQRPRFARQLLVGLFHVVQVEVRVAERMDELAGFEAAYLRRHQRQ